MLKKTVKKIIFCTLVTAVVTAIAIGTTFAYLTRGTEQRLNNFTFASDLDGINAKLTEPNWDGVIDYAYDENGNITDVIYGYTDEGDPIYGYENGDITKPITEPTGNCSGLRPITDSEGNKITYGVDQAKNMIPGSTVSKNPIITNTGTLTDEWVAAKVTLVYAKDVDENRKKGTPLIGEDLTNVTKIIEINYNDFAENDDDTAYWDRIEGTYNQESGNTASVIFYYTEILSKSDTESENGETTEPLFTNVKVKVSATSTDVAAVDEIGGFDIFVEGFAVQSDVASAYNANSNDTGFYGWGRAGGVVFNNTPTEENPAEDLGGRYTPSDN